MIVGVFMNSTDRLLLSKLERALQKKHTKTHGSPVNIKDILVIQSFKDEGAGMFRRLVGETISIAEMTGTESHPDPEDETRDQLLGRMETHIRDQLTLANQTHLADNFTGQDKTHLKAGAENNITRLSFSEFSFYPKPGVEHSSDTMPNFRYCFYLTQRLQNKVLHLQKQLYSRHLN